MRDRCTGRPGPLSCWGQRRSTKKPGCARARINPTLLPCRALTPGAPRRAGPGEPAGQRRDASRLRLPRAGCGRAQHVPRQHHRVRHRGRGRHPAHWHQPARGGARVQRAVRLRPACVGGCIGPYQRRALGSLHAQLQRRLRQRRELASGRRHRALDLHGRKGRRRRWQSEPVSSLDTCACPSGRSWRHAAGAGSAGRG